MAGKGDILKPAGNCWRIETADRARLIVDADDYFAAARAGMKAARRRIMLIGWDFDARIRIGEAEDGAPARIGDFILWLVKRNPELEVYLLRWDFGALKSLLRGNTIFVLMRWWKHRRIHVKFDSMHPPGASHHQKIVVIDDSLAFCGGIDMTDRRWDRRTHEDGDPRRIGPGGKPYGPWHDATMALEGPAAAALGALAAARWRCATGRARHPVAPAGSLWPQGLEPDFEDTQVAISRTRPEHKGLKACHEIERLSLDLIARARRFIYAENQYFASRRIGEAIAERMAEPDGPEIMLIGPERADGWLEQEAMDSARARLWRSIGKVDARRRFRIYHPFTAAGEPIYVHAKIMVVDDLLLRVGSSNWNNRSLGLDSECDVSIERGEAEGAMAAIRNGLMAEHLGCPPERVAAAFAETGSLIETVERLRGAGRSLRPYQPPELSEVEKALADKEALDPERPEDVFEPFSGGGLLRRLPGLRRGR
jgi:phosphatidylserine/phosphatidylglycerophosphate/cardiolipin synthase-like enzyme